MKKIILSFLLSVSLAMIAAAQSKSCYGDWGLFQNVNAPGANINFRIAFKQPLSRKEECQYIFYRFENVYPIPGAILRFKVDYLKPDGSTATEKFGYVELARQGIYEPSGNFLLGHQIIRIYDGEFQPPKKENTSDDNLLPQSGQNRTKNKINTPPSPGTPVQQNPGTRMDGMGSRAENTQPKVETYASTNNQNTQQAQYQNTANNYVNAAQSSTNEINKAMNLSIAKINAQAAGNTAQVLQIQRAQTQQQVQNTEQMVNATFGLLGTLSDMIDRKKKTQEQTADDRAKGQQQLAADRLAWGQALADKASAYKAHMLLATPIQQVEDIYKILLLNRFHEEGELFGAKYAADSTLMQITGYNTYNTSNYTWYHSRLQSIKPEDFYHADNSYKIPGKTKYFQGIPCSDDAKKVALAMQQGCDDKEIHQSLADFMIAATTETPIDVSAGVNDKQRASFYLRSVSVHPQGGNWRQWFNFGKIGLLQAKAMVNISTIYYSFYLQNNKPEDLKQPWNGARKACNIILKTWKGFLNTKTYNGQRIEQDENMRQADDADYIKTKFISLSNYLKLNWLVLNSKLNNTNLFPADTTLAYNSIKMFNHYYAAPNGILNYGYEKYFYPDWIDYANIVYNNKDNIRSRCRQELQLLVDSKTGIDKVYQQQKKDLPKMLFCSSCLHSKKEIEAAGENFIQHLKRTRAIPVKATSFVKKKLEDDYHAAINNLAAAVEKKTMECGN